LIPDLGMIIVVTFRL